MIERLNSATNIIGFAIVLAGVGLLVFKIDAGRELFALGGGIITGHAIATTAQEQK